MIKPLITKISASVSFLLLFTHIICGQAQTVSCNDLKTGVFHIYPKNSPDHYIVVREGEFVRETKVNTGDSSLYKITWLNGCTYSLQYLSGSEKMTDEMAKFLKKHKMVYDMQAVTNDYYVYKGYIDKVANLPISTDTVWFNEKTNVVNNTIYTPVSLTEAKIKDTSKYALLYIYRPGKITNSLAAYLIYFDDNALCVARNNSGYIFKVFKEGKYQVKSRLFKDESSIDVDVKNGHVYYLKSMINWGVKSRGYNFKLEMAAVPNEVGRAEFLNVRFE